MRVLLAEPHARRFFLAWAQSCLGTGAAVVALALVAYDRHPSAWGISLVLLADFLPAVCLGPLFGAMADAWSRKRCLLVAETVRMVAFAGLAVAPNFEATVALALVAGVGTALFRPAAKAALPGIVGETRIATGLALFGICTDVGVTVGPAVAAVLLLVFDPEAVLLLNAGTFLVSASLLARTRLAAPETVTLPGLTAGMWSQARAGLQAARRLPGVGILLGSSGAVILAAATMNVAEPLYAVDVLGVGASGFALLVGSYGLGTVFGWLSGKSAKSQARMLSRYVMGMLLAAAGLMVSGLAGIFPLAIASFALTGFGNGVFMVNEQLLLQKFTTDQIRGRIFGIKDAIDSSAFVIAFLAAGLVIGAVGVRGVLAGAGVATAVVGVVAAMLLRGWRHESSPRTTTAGAKEAPAAVA